METRTRPLTEAQQEDILRAQRQRLMTLSTKLTLALSVENHDRLAFVQQQYQQQLARCRKDQGPWVYTFLGGV